MLSIQKMKKYKGYYIVVTDVGQDGGQFLAVTKAELQELCGLLKFSMFDKWRVCECGKTKPKKK
jgi:hypothetical protein